MNGFLTDAPYIAAILGVTLGCVAFGCMYVRNAEVKLKFYDFATGETNAALISADRVLKNGATPELVRRVLLCMLETVASPELGKHYVEQFMILNRQKKARPGSTNALSEAMDKLHAQNPELAADAHKALMGLILALPLMHAEKIDVTEITALEYAGEGATNPGSVFDRASKALSSFEKPGNPNGGLAAA